MDEKEIEAKMIRSFELANIIFEKIAEKLKLNKCTDTKTVSVSIMATEIFKWLKKEPEKK